MVNAVIYRQTLKSNLKLWLIFTIVTSALLMILIAVFEPTTISGVVDMIKDTAIADMLKNTSFLGMMASTFYTLHGVILPLVYIIITANGLVAAKVDRGSMAYLLSTPARRSTIVITQAVYLITALAAMFAVVTLVGVMSIHLFHHSMDVDMSDFLLLNLGLFLLMFATSGISFFFSCLFNLAKNSIALGAGIPIAFFVFELMASVNEDLEVFKYVSLNTLFDKDAILSGEGYLIFFLMLVFIGLVLYGLGIQVFKQKDLPL